MLFSEALELLRSGSRIKSESWSKGEHIELGMGSNGKPTIYHVKRTPITGILVYNLYNPSGSDLLKTDWIELENIVNGSKNLDFGKALDAMKKGCRVSREGWNDVHLQINIITSIGEPQRYLIYKCSRDKCNKLEVWEPDINSISATDWEIL